MEKDEAIRRAETQLGRFRLSPTEASAQGLKVRQDGVVRTGLELLRLPSIDLPALARIWPTLSSLEPDVAQQIEIEAQYAAYLPRQMADIGAFRQDEAMKLPDGFNPDDIAGLSREIRMRLAESCPTTLGAAARLPGMTPAALSLLHRHAKQACRH